jgi:hypothetical protein
MHFAPPSRKGQLMIVKARSHSHEERIFFEHGLGYFCIVRDFEPGIGSQP